MNTKLRVSEISKIYPGCVANDKISLEFGSGKIYALLGENGAGKSTLVKILSGVVRPDKGEVFLNDESIKLNSPLDAKKIISEWYSNISIYLKLYLYLKT